MLHVPRFYKMVGYCFFDDSTIIQIYLYPMASTKETMKLAQAELDLFSGVAKPTWV